MKRVECDGKIKAEISSNVVFSIWVDAGDGLMACDDGCETKKIPTIILLRAWPVHFWGGSGLRPGTLCLGPCIPV